jgi:hypothetical protein
MKTEQKFLTFSVIFVIGFRVLYVAKYGWDGCWMNYNFLLEAKAFALARTTEENGLALTPLLLFFLRRIGLTSLAALSAAYLVAQAIFTLAAMRLFDFFVPESGWRRRLLFVLVLATVPLLSTDTAYKDSAVLLGAAMLLVSLAFALSTAASTRPYIADVMMTCLCGAVAIAFRFEALAGLLFASVILLVCHSSDRPIAGIVRARRAGLALFAGVMLGVLLVLSSSFVLRGKAELSSSAYRFYTFYDGLPALMLPANLLRPGEYGRYMASLTYFGSYFENGGSLWTALLSHPGWALLRVALKIPDLITAIASLKVITPVGFVFAAVGLYQSLRTHSVNSFFRSRSIILLSFLGPALLLLVPPANDRYLLSLIFPVLLLITIGLDLTFKKLSDRAFRRFTVVYLMICILVIMFFGRIEVSNSATITEAALYLESVCQSGCLVNYVPQALSSQAWVDLEAGALLPTKIKRSESFVLGNYTASYADDCRFDTRVRRAIQRGYTGPILYVDVRVTSSSVFSETFDPEHKFDATPPDLSSARSLAKFENDGDTIVIYRIGEHSLN